MTASQLKPLGVNFSSLSWKKKKKKKAKVFQGMNKQEICILFFSRKEPKALPLRGL
jgi:hypothetical protein